MATNILRKSDPEVPPQADQFRDWPKRFTKKYVDWCESRLEDGLCCAHKLFEAPMPITNLQDLSGCTLLVIPETQVGSPYYNPLFMPKDKGGLETHVHYWEFKSDHGSIPVYGVAGASGMICDCFGHSRRDHFWSCIVFRARLVRLLSPHHRGCQAHQRKSASP